MNQIEIILGPMFAGKTTELIRRLRRYKIANKKCIILKCQRDNRYETDKICTHDKGTMDAIPCEKLCSVDCDNYDVIGIDEGQFFPDLLQFCKKVTNKIIVIASLDGDFKQQPFGNTLQLIPKATSVVKLNAVCNKCYGDAPFTTRIVDDNNVELIGGTEYYIAICKDCMQ